MEELINEIDQLKFKIKRAGHNDHFIAKEEYECKLEQAEETLLNRYGITFKEWELKN